MWHSLIENKKGHHNFPILIDLLDSMYLRTCEIVAMFTTILCLDNCYLELVFK